MPDDAENLDTPNASAAAPAPPHPGGCLMWLMICFMLSGLLGMVLAFLASQQNADDITIFFAFFGPPFASVVIYLLVVMPRFIRQAREAARNAPSPESTAAIAHGEGVEVGVAGKPITFGGRPPNTDLPTVHVADTQPGRVLAYSLFREGMPPGCAFGCSLVGSVFWNSIVGVFLYQQVAQWRAGQQVQWLEVLFLVPFAGIGLVLIGVSVLAALKMVVSGFVGRVEVELAQHPLVPAAAGRMNIAQTGNVPLRRVTVALICTEEATYVAGTSKSTAKKEVMRFAVSKPDETAGADGLPLNVEFTVPADAMHSFDAPNNKIKWTVRIIGSVFGFLPFTVDYSVTVSPASEEEGVSG